jgi:hypothetical protein
MSGFCEDANEPSGFVQSGNVIYSNCQPLMEDQAPWSYVSNPTCKNKVIMMEGVSAIYSF